RTHLAAPPSALRVPLRFDPAFDPRRTDFLSRMVERWGHFEGALTAGSVRHCYGYVGLADRRMVPLLRPGSLVLVDTAMRHIENEAWSCEHDRPMYLVDVRDGYRCGWFHQIPGRLLMEPHPLSRCAPESWALPGEAEVVGKVIGVVSRLNEPWNSPLAEFQAERAGSKRRAPCDNPGDSPVTRRDKPQAHAKATELKHAPQSFLAAIRSGPAPEWKAVSLE